MRDMVGEPEKCVTYFSGNITKPITYSKELMRNEELHKTKILEEAVRNPSIPKPFKDEGEAADELLEAYANISDSGVELFGNLSKIGEIQADSPKEACEAAIKMIQAISTLGEERGARLWKNLSLESNQSNL